MKLIKKKSVQAAITVTLAVLIILAGVMAWGSFTQNKVNRFYELHNPNANLHDDFYEGPNKDVYVENSGTAPVYLRVRLTEFLQTEQRGSLVEGHVRDESQSHLWAPHNGIGGVQTCQLTQDAPGYAWIGEDFHTYYTWLMGGSQGNGQIYFKPATQEQRGDYGMDGGQLKEPTVVTDPLTETQGDAHLYYQQQVQALAEAGKTQEEALEELGIQQTMTASVLTMEQWRTGDEATGRAPYALGSFWVMDELDGWCYWANPLEGGTATGLLLDRVDRTKQPFDSSAEYCINVSLQAVDAGDLGRLEMADAGGISPDGKKLLQLAAGKIVLDQDGNSYRVEEDGTFSPEADKDGNAVEAPPFVPLVEPSVNVPQEDRLEIGAVVNLAELTWDGARYTNLSAYDQNAPFYNLMVQENGAYTVEGLTLASDGNYYVNLRSNVDRDVVLHIGSVAEAPAVTRAVTPAPKYLQTYPGNGPFALIYPQAGGDLVGDDGEIVRGDPRVGLEGRHFLHRGNGVYIQTETAESETSVDNRYYFAGKELTRADEIGAVIANVFPLQLTAGDKLYPTLEPVSDGKEYLGSYGSGGTPEWDFKGLVTGQDGLGYLHIGSPAESASKPDSYVAPGRDNFLGNSGDLRVWPGPDGNIGTADDTFTHPGDFDEPFLQGKRSEDVGIGKAFTSKDYSPYLRTNINWTVLDIDQYGNRFIAATRVTFRGVNGDGTTAITEAGNVYIGSNLETQINNHLAGNFPLTADGKTNNLDNLKPYVLPASIPQTGLSAPYYTENGQGGMQFPLSKDEAVKYRERLSVGISDTFITRTPGAAANTWYHEPFSKDGNVWEGMCNVQSIRTAMWVRFSDADTIATATAAELAAWKNFTGPTEDFLAGKSSDDLKAGGTFQADGREWVVLSVDEYGNRLVLSKDQIASMGARAAGQYQVPEYADSLWPARAVTFMDTLTNLKPVALPATLPQEPVYTGKDGTTSGPSWAELPQSDGLSLPHSGETPITFPLSANEYCKYVEHSPGVRAYAEQHFKSIWGLRSRYTQIGQNVQAGKQIFAGCVDGNGQAYSAYANTYYPPRMALWVRFSDADKIATATPEELAAWKAGG